MFLRLSPRGAWCAGLIGLTLGAPLRAEDLTELPLEQLLNTEVVSAARFARQVTDAASAVSLLTAQDIQALGLRTLGEVLAQMRGLQVTSDGDYLYLGARGFGGPGAYAGRVLMLVDGVPASDNLFDQIFLGHDALIDVAMIDRIEYAPGAGSAMYGNNAFLGVINIVTRRGRDLNGWEGAVSGGPHGDGKLRLSMGRREEGGAEWLASLSLHSNDGTPSSDLRTLPYREGDAQAWQLLLKGQWEAFSLQAMGSNRTVNYHYPEAAATELRQDGGYVVSMGHDHAFEGGALAGWRSSVKAQLGSQRYNYGVALGDYLGTIQSAGRWWSLDSQAGYDGWDGHRLVLGLRLREDPKLHYDTAETEYAPSNLAMHRKSVGVSVEDEMRLTDKLVGTLGLRADRRTSVDWTYSPRAALVYTPTASWQLKGSMGRATRFASAAEEAFGQAPQDHGEHVRHRELGAEYRHDTLRWLTTVYDYRMSALIWPNDQVTSMHGHGVETEVEWQWHGLRVRASQTWQHSDDNLGQTLNYSPRGISKLQLSLPLDGERWRLSTAVSRSASYTTDFNDGKRAPYALVPDATRIDLTLLGLKVIGNLDLTLGLRNLGNTPDHTLDPYLDNPADWGRKTRYGWVELRGHF